MEVDKLLKQLREERAQIQEAILSLQRLAGSRCETRGQRNGMTRRLKEMSDRAADGRLIESKRRNS